MSHIYRHIILTALITLLCAVPALAQQKETVPLRFGAFAYDAATQSLTYVQRVLDELFEHVDRQAVLINIPGLRDLSDANRGIIDGCTFRTLAAAEGYPDLSPIPEPVGLSGLAAFSLKSSPFSDRSEDLAEMTVAVLKGDMVALKYLQMHGANILEVQSCRQGLKTVRLKRTEIFICDRPSGLRTVRQEGRKDIHVGDYLCAYRLWILMNEKHAPLLESLAQKLRSMRENGSLQEAMGPFGYLARNLDKDSPLSKVPYVSEYDRAGASE